MALEIGFFQWEEYRMNKKSRLIGVEGLQGQALDDDQARFVEAFRQERMIQYTRDRTDVLRRLDPELWKAFSLRWNLPPPYPTGWGDADSVLAVQHKTRLMLHEFSQEEKKFSAAWLLGHGFALPQGLEFENGVVSGDPTPYAPRR
jgi:hypothetical protein